MVPTYNEEENVVPLCEAIMAEFARSLPQYDYEIVFIDNCSKDSTREKLTMLCDTYPHVRAIFNARNFGQFNSPSHGICQTTGDCTIPLCADFQDPIEMIPQLVAEWDKGYKVICKKSVTLLILKSVTKQIQCLCGFTVYSNISNIFI